MIVERATLGNKEIVVRSNPVEMGTFGHPNFGTGENQAGITQTLACLLIELLKQDACKAALALAEVGGHGNHILAPIIIVEERRVETIAVQVYWLTPGAHDGRSGHHIVVGILEVLLGVDNRIDQVEGTLVVGQTRRPYTGGVEATSHIELADPVQGAGQQFPVDQVLAVVNLHTGKPLERGGGDIVIIPYPEEGRIGVEPLENRICNACHGISS
ncbi:hypothetical protein SDC9_76008 [bioreactor metagenome]|uniref:Uncharacterized protein n=1 Tax=bioreactor metagenome TaxID=1076179 RepID=A0A644YNA2_9ZZZZ